nr:hypothetical protein [uncultured Niameybacter sp.]
MPLLTKRELFASLGLGTVLGLIVALFLVSKLTPSKVDESSFILSELSFTTLYKDEPTSFSFYNAYSKEHSFPDIINIPMEIYMNHPTTKTSNYHLINVRVSFYTGLAIENGGYEELNALGAPLTIGSLAAPSDIPFGTSFIIKNLPPDVQTDTFTVDDRGGAIKRINHNTIKVDVYVKRQQGESDAKYFDRTNNLGIIYTKALYKVPQS